ncbi:flagellar transcriptional regulator FlhD [Paraburkholderia sp. GAS334]|uniref:flagellar transcriptional regulator FlhD n=1 Tax=Paraburkholderia sp. GAS334 TaxID=3035131 RepID=UPI003D235707
MGTTDMLNLVRDFNLAYLLLVQNLLREDRIAGATRFCVSPQIAEILIALSDAQIARLAATPHVLCHFHFHVQPVLAALSDVRRPAEATSATGPSVSEARCPL